ncbi:MAU2 chromatid cohesion factor-like protein [Operophtera brumata]|uniref:Cohesin loading complex subunit SCC4 homolog n=1 Tax=Operophtera brumata TaxID=104452 RepID=A0A0L7LLU5_OPEBR|nr:MAU2 chromatid cohesion factor-like protein [Operophtera brumata]
MVTPAMQLASKIPDVHVQLWASAILKAVGVRHTQRYLHNNSRESMNMVTPAMQLASKIPDVHVQLWASAILKGTYTTTRASP